MHNQLKWKKNGGKKRESLARTFRVYNPRLQNTHTHSREQLSHTNIHSVSHTHMLTHALNKYGSDIQYNRIKFQNTTK